MTSNKKMNNKVKVSKFWAMGGVCLIELWPDLPYMLGKPYFFGANSIKSLAKVYEELREMTYAAAEKTGRTDIYMGMLIRSISFKLDGFWYECENAFLLRDSDYLYVKEKVCK